MYINELGVKEINQYYSNHGGHRTARIKNFANFMEKAKTGRTAAPGRASRLAETKESETTESAKTRRADSPAESSDNEKACCEKCQLTNRLMLQMLSGSLYSRSGLGGLNYLATGSDGLGGLGYTAAGSGALAAYQSLSRYFGKS